MKHLGLFSGIGGFELAAKWMNWETSAWCEIDEFCRQVLGYYFPYADKLSDITKEKFKKYANKIDIITGGFPCQPYSLSGARQGTEDPRHLWPQMLRCVRVVRPAWVIGENVYGLLSWSGGLVFEQVQADLEAEGYEVQPYILPACSVNAPHQRDRIWFVAYARHLDRSISKQQRTKRQAHIDSDRKVNSGITTHPEKLAWRTWGTDSTGQKHTETLRRDFFINAERPCEIITATDSNVLRRQYKSDRIRESGFTNERGKSYDWSDFPTQSPVCSGDDGLSLGLDGITFSSWRRKSIKGYGNAVVPQEVYRIYQAVEEFRKINTSQI